ncbi:Signal peptidase I [Halorhabdus sp. SVX81]|uniref:S26 family signal peptidase n=1 Tax=Halorhabdus sp. SVX81 TaxID=2978283 RepID=UPI0023DB400C|nr:S26 family signal peptidase [Halorhabdus sp. SVX81]WEL16188.1 Signal peptidase I [Halorhabdus sp. SVX81]
MGNDRERKSAIDRVLESSLALFAFDTLSSVLIVVMIGGFLFATSGVWSPVVAVESGSMQPHMDVGDTVFVMEDGRFPGPGSQGESGVVTAHTGRKTGYRTFGGYGDVIVYQPDGNETATPIIHRAMLWVENEENWYDRADSTAIGNADSCAELVNCPAPHAGFITKGDNTVTNSRYDQVIGISDPVKPKWIVGTAEVGVPWLGQLRLARG